jgi:hypothetical protein
LRQHPGGNVARCARAEADDDPHRPRRIVLRGSSHYEKRRETVCERREAEREEEELARFPPPRSAA